jgi:hypothetical protein
MKLYLILMAFSMSLFLSCSSQKTMNRNGMQAAISHDAVMSAGEEVVFKNPNGSGKIIYVSEFVRRYEMNGNFYNVELVQRAKAFDHRNGIYNPGETWGPINIGDGVPSRFVVDESELRFSTMAECSRFFKEGAAYEKWVSNDQGLVLGFDLSPERDQVNVSLYRCFIAGKRIKGMPAQFKHAGFVHIKSNHD